MNGVRWLILVVLIPAAACGARHYGHPEQLTASEAAAVETGVRAFAQTVATDVTRGGPSAWCRHFAGTPAFFMALDGRLAFSDGVTGAAGIQDAARAIPQIRLIWGDAQRVDALSPSLAMFAAPYHEFLTFADGRRQDATGYFSGLVEYRRGVNGSKQEGRWQFRNAHWSSAAALNPAQ